MNSTTPNPAQAFASESVSPRRGVLGSTLLLLGLALASSLNLSCGGEEPPKGQVRSSSSEKTGSAARTEGQPELGATAETNAASAEAEDSGEVMVITRATSLLPKSHRYNIDPLREGRLPTGEGIWFSYENPREKRSVDRHIKGFELISQSFGLKYRDSRRAVVLIATDNQSWKSPLVRVPKKGSLSFSYMPYVVGMGGFSMSLDFRVLFEVEGAGGRSTSVEIWKGRHALRPPTGGTWREASVDLSELAGREGRLVFDAVAVEGTYNLLPEDLAVAFGNPTIKPAKDERPNLLVISIDTLRKDAISPYGADPSRTPALQSIADSGVVFDQFWSSAPWTLPSYASFFTAEYPSTHGAGADRDAEVVPGTNQPTLGIASGIPSLVTHFRDLGYNTQSFYSNGHLNLQSGIERGFDGYVWYGLTGTTATEAFHEWSGHVNDQPFFAFVQMTDPHWPYVVPWRFAKNLEMPYTADNESLKGSPVKMFTKGIPEEDREDFTAVYGHLVEYMDKHVGSILRTLEKRGLTENTLVVFHTDHGEELWDHGEWWHGHTHHAELENVSLLMSWPGHLDPGTRISTPVRSVDILPTALDLMGLPPVEHEIEGKSFGYLLRGEEGDPIPPILHEAQLYGPGGDFALTKWPWRLLVQQPAPWVQRAKRLADPEAFVREEVVQLFNIEEDPLELHDLAAENPEIVAAMRKKAESLRARALERKVGLSEPADMGTDDDADGLRALGYK